jgi:hypothetical protein
MEFLHGVPENGVLFKKLDQQYRFGIKIKFFASSSIINPSNRALFIPKIPFDNKF